MNRLRAIEIFIQVADMGSFQKASQALGITPQAASKAIAQIERELGIKLLQRNTRQSRLTDEGTAFLTSVRQGVEILDTAWGNARESYTEPRGTLRLTCGLNFGGRVLMPLIEEFQARYPRIEVELIASDQFVDIVQEGIDIGFRNGLEPSGKHHTTRLFDLQLIVCAAPSYLRQHGFPTTRFELSQHHCTGSRQINSGRIEPWEFMEDGETVFQKVPSAFWVNDADIETQAVIRGMGIGLLANLNIVDALRDGSLIPVFAHNVSTRYGVYLYYPGHRRLPDRAQRFIEFAHSRLRDNRDYTFSQEELRAYRERFIETLHDQQS